MHPRTYTFVLPQDSPRREILHRVNALTGARILSVLHEDGTEGPYTVQTDRSIFTIRSLITHITQNARDAVRRW